MESFLKKYAIDEQCEGLEVYYERAKREYSVHGNEIMDFEKYQVFTYMEEDIRRIRDELVKDSDNVLYAYFLNEAIRAKDDFAIKALSMPKREEENEIFDTLPLFSLLYEIPTMAYDHRFRLVPKDVTDATKEMFQNQIGDFILLNGRYGISSYVNWMLKFLRSKIIRVGRFNLEICKYSHPFELFKKGEELCLLSVGGRYHKSGRVLGSVGVEDEDGSFSANASERDGYYVGLRVENGIVVNEEMRLSAEEWNRVLSVGDTVVSVHIPTGGPLSPEVVEADLRRGEEIIKTSFSDFSFFYCSSWLLDTNIKKIVGKEGNLTRFGDRFLRFPVKSSGDGVYEYVFNQKKAISPDLLVANNSFSLAMKDHLMAGGHIYGAGGLMPCFGKGDERIALIPRPLQIVVDDVGWFNAKDDRKDGGPSRTGMPRRHVAEDIYAINRLGEALNMNIPCAIVVGEWDPDNRLRTVPHLSKYGEGWDNAAYLDREEMKRFAEAFNNSPYIETAIHGLLHGYYLDGIDNCDTSDYYYHKNGELYMVDVDEIKERIRLFRELFEHYGIKKKTESFVPPSFAYRFNELSRVLSELGIKFNSTIFNTMVYDGEKPYAAAEENGIVTVDRNNNIYRWFACDCSYEDLPYVSGIFGSHWPNFLHPDASRNSEVVDRAVAYFKRAGSRYGAVLSSGMEFCAIQSLYHSYAEITYGESEILVDLSALSDSIAKGKPFVISSRREFASVLGGSSRIYEEQDGFVSYLVTPESSELKILLTKV